MLLLLSKHGKHGDTGNMGIRETWGYGKHGDRSRIEDIVDEYILFCNLNS